MLLFYYAAHSDAELAQVCSELQAEFGLKDFQYDVHDNWEHAHATKEGLELNVTKADDSNTIEQWIPGTPSGVNYQIIITAQAEPENATDVICRVLRSPVSKFAESHSAA